MATSDLGACEWFVWNLQRSGLIDRGQLEQVVGEYMKAHPRAEPEGLAAYLVQREILTPFQAQRILEDKAQGLVLGAYMLTDAIGNGSMGQVYKAQSRSDGQEYAVKVLPRRSMWNVRLARRQVRAFESLSHPAVVPFVDVGTAGGLHYLVWPYVEGETLESLVQRQGRLTPDQAATVGLQVAQALNVCHQRELFHGLLKPSNVMIGLDGQARILDFGIGSLLVENEGESLVDTMSAANALTSGLDCAAPECIVEPTNRTPAGDQYSLGCVLYYCLTGRYPFPDGSAVEKMMAHQFKQPPPLRELAPDVPEKLARVVERLMQKAPEARYAGADEVVEVLRPLAREVPLPVQKPARPAAPVFTPPAGFPVTGPLVDPLPDDEESVLGYGPPRAAPALPAVPAVPAVPASRGSLPPPPRGTMVGPPALVSHANLRSLNQPGRRPGGWVGEPPRRYSIGQTGMALIAVGLLAAAYFVATVFFFN